jgi:hypothetical protein
MNNLTQNEPQWSAILTIRKVKTHPITSSSVLQSRTKRNERSAPESNMITQQSTILCELEFKNKKQFKNRKTLKCCFPTHPASPKNPEQYCLIYKRNVYKTANS